MSERWLDTSEEPRYYITIVREGFPLRKKRLEMFEERLVCVNKQRGLIERENPDSYVTETGKSYSPYQPFV